MPDSIMYQEDHFVVLSPELIEQFVSLPELEEILKQLLQKIPSQDLPRDLQKFLTSETPKEKQIEKQIEHLIKTACELDCQEFGVWQWYAVRLQKPKTTL